MNVKRATKKRKRVRFFYWEGKLHKVLRISYPENLVEAWCFQDRKSVALLYTDFKRNAGGAYRTGYVCSILNIARRTLFYAIERGDIRPVERSYRLDGRFVPDKMWWSDSDVIDLHEALLSIHRGRPRKDGKITPNQNLPSRAELKAMLRNEQTLYVQTDDGRMVPVFEQQRW